MCGRYALYGPSSKLRKQFDADFEDLDYTPRWNAAPMQWLPVIRQRSDGSRILTSIRRGLVPSWAKDQAIAARLINARGETLAEKPAFRSAFRRRRCIVPVSGFYEWQAAAGAKQPWFIYPVGGEDLFGLAGLWERWTRPADGEVIDSFTIVTTEANAYMRILHERMPVVLQPDSYAAWLDAAADPGKVAALLRPCADTLLDSHRVSKPVGNVRNDGPELVELV